MGPAEDLTNSMLDGRYRLVRLLGVGGMGQVYEGMHEMLDRKIAVKVLLPRYAYEVRYRERFLREAKAASKVRHPNVVQILDFGDTPNGSVYFAMEFLEGRDLSTILREDGRLPWARAKHLLLQITSALGAAHELKIIHRDIKPANFFVINARGHQEFVKVLDFGIAKITAADGDESAQALTGTGEIFGTAKYMAPEQAYGYSDDPRVDVYSVGVVAYEMLTGQVPFDGVSTFDIISRHVSAPPPPMRQIEPSIPPEVEAIIMRALGKRQEERFASMDEMERALAAVPAGPGAPTYTPANHSEAFSVAMVSGPGGIPAGHPSSPVQSAPAMPVRPGPMPGQAPMQRPGPMQGQAPVQRSGPMQGQARPGPMPGQSGSGPVQGQARPPGSGPMQGQAGVRPLGSGPMQGQAGARPPGSGPMQGQAGARPPGSGPMQGQAPGQSGSGPVQGQASPGSGPVQPPGSGPMPAPDSGMTVVAAAPTGPVPSNVVPVSQHPSSDGSGPGVIPGAMPAGPSVGADTGSGPAARMAAAPLAPETSTSGLVRTVQTPEIDRAQLMLDDELEPPSSKKGLVVGLLAGAGVLGLVLAIALGSSDDDQTEAKGKAEPPRVITAKQPEPEPAPPKTTPVVMPEPTTPEPATPEPEAIDPEVVVDPEPEPTTPEPEPKATKPRPKPSEPAPLTDKKVRWRLSRALKKKCKNQATGPVTVDLLVGSDGKVLSKSFSGASSGLKSCMIGVVSSTKFPAEGKARKQSFKVDF